MDKSKLTAAILLLFAATSVAYDKPAKQPTKQATTQKVLLKSDKTIVSHRPKAPSRQVVTCEYDGTYLTFGFVLPEGVCEATVTENFSGTSRTYTFDSTPLTADVYVGELYESTVTMTTASGNTYTGSLTADPE